MIRFNKGLVVGSEIEYISKSINGSKLSGDGDYSEKCHLWFNQKLNCSGVFLTPSCTHALEMAALLLNISDGDEIIVPSYTFVSTANAFAMHGAKIVFIDVNPSTMNIDESLIENAITERTVAIVPVHYAGVSCDMDILIDIADKYNLIVIEDAAQGMMSTYKGRPLGSIGDIGVYSFHETKNYTSGGEGGLLIINNPKMLQRARIIRDKGTNRHDFNQGKVDKYSWVDLGGSYLMNEISAAYLYSQLQVADSINSHRLKLWNIYNNELKNLEIDNFLTLPLIPDYSKHNAHMYYIRVKTTEESKELISYLRMNGIEAVTHYVPLHSSEAGYKFGVFIGKDAHTTVESKKLVRLPMYFELTDLDVFEITKTIKKFYRNLNNGSIACLK